MILKINLRLQFEGLTSEHCMDIEYRSQIAINYEGPKHDEDFYEL